MADYHVWCPHQGEAREDASTHKGDSPEEAARDWAEQKDWSSADYFIVSGREEPEVLVAPVDWSAVPVLIRVSGEAVPVYTARRVSQMPRRSS